MKRLVSVMALLVLTDALMRSASKRGFQDGVRWASERWESHLQYLTANGDLLWAEQLERNEAGDFGPVPGPLPAMDWRN